eukprot:323992-Pelagomonas_calceolata.AAC.2
MLYIRGSKLVCATLNCYKFAPVTCARMVISAKKRLDKNAEENLPTSMKEKEAHWLRRALSPLHHKYSKQKALMGIWRVTRSTRFQSL